MGEIGKDVARRRLRATFFVWGLGEAPDSSEYFRTKPNTFVFLGDCDSIFVQQFQFPGCRVGEHQPEAYGTIEGSYKFYVEMVT